MKALILAIVNLLCFRMIYSQSFQTPDKKRTAISAGYDIGGTLWWNKHSYNEKERRGMILNFFAAFESKKMSCKVMFSQTGEIDIWGISDDELQTAVAFLFGKQFTGKNSFVSFMAGPSYTSVLYRSYQLVVLPAYTTYTTSMAKEKYMGLTCEAKAGTGRWLGRFYPYLAVSLQGNVSKKGSYAGITGGAGIKVHLGKRSAKKE